MNLQVALSRLESLTPAELNHARHLATIEIENYGRAIKSYPPERRTRFGAPHMRSLMLNLEKIDAAIKARKGPSQ